MATGKRRQAGSIDGAPPRRRMRGFEPAATLVARDVRGGAESRGFAVARLLTHWPEIAGAGIAAHTRPVRISHGRDFGATLTLLSDGAHAPMVQMQLPMLRQKINAVYGFNAIARITLTQTAPHGFAEGQADFTHRTRRPADPPPPDAGTIAAADGMAAGFADPQLAQAIHRLALNHLSRRDHNNRKASP